MKFNLALIAVIIGCAMIAPVQAQAPVQPQAPLDYRVSWIGNSFGGAQKWVQQDIAALCVSPEGAVYTNVPWDEAGRNAGVYQNGDCIAQARHTHGWGYEGGNAIAINNKYVFIAQSVGNEGGGLKDEKSWPLKGFGWQGVSRRLRADITQGAPFEGGKGGAGDTLKNSFLVVSQTPENSKASIVGMCANEKQLYVADSSDQSVKIYDVETMKLLATWPIGLAHVGPLALDAKGALWMLYKGASEGALYNEALVPVRATAAQIGPAGDRRQRLILPPAVQPSAIAFDPRGRLLVADDGPSQQILIYDNLATKPRLQSTLGIKGGIYAGTPGAFGNWKLNRVSALGCDAKGNIYIAQDAHSGGGGTVLESYQMDGGALNWRLFGLEFVDMADADPQSPADVFTKEEHFRMDYARPSGSEWSYAGYTIDRFRFPDDPRLHIWSAGAQVRRINGRRFLFVHDMNAEYLQVYRFEGKSEIAIPCALFSKRHIDDKNGWPAHQPLKGEWIWRDLNGNGAFDADEFLSRDTNAPDAQGWCVDEAGNIWLATENDGIRLFPIQPIDARGVPNWNFVSMRTFAKPTEFEQVKRLRYDFAHDVMYLGGTSTEHHNQHWKPMGPVICRYDGWLRGANINANKGGQLRWRIVAPYAKGSSGHESCEPMGFDICGNCLFIPYTGASKAIGFSTGHIEVFALSDGAALGHMEPSPDIGEIGLQDIRECLTARQKPDGEYLVFLEEDWKSKILLYRMRPPRQAAR